MRSTDQSEILRGHGWNAGLQYYDFLQSIRFGRDGRGTMSQGDGQAIKIEVGFRYSLPAPGTLHLEFLDTPSAYSPEELAFERNERNASRHIAFDLIPGPHEVSCGTMGGMVRRGFLWLLRFQSEPFPVGHEPSVMELDYYGRPLRAGELV